MSMLGLQMEQTGVQLGEGGHQHCRPLAGAISQRLGARRKGVRRKGEAALAELACSANAEFISVENRSREEEEEH
jgi:hypothetical protein